MKPDRSEPIPGAMSLALQGSARRAARTAASSPDPVRIRQFAAMIVMAGIGRVGYERQSASGAHPAASGDRIAAGQ